MDPERVLSLARYLRRCRSTPDLTFTEVSLLSKTLTARATRLESTSSRSRLEAENEAYKRATIAKRRRALGPKNASDFMRQTIRDREKTREINRVKAADSRASHIPLQAEPAIRRRRSLDQPPRGASSEIAPSLPLRETTHSNHSAPTSSGTSRADRARRAGNDGQERPPTRNQELEERNLPTSPCTTTRTDCWNLEDDDDVRILLDRAYSSTSSIRGATAPRPATSRGKRFRKTRPESSQSHGRSHAVVEPPPARHGPSSLRCKDFLRRPQTAGAGGRIKSVGSRKNNPSAVVQLRRNMLLRSHGEGDNMHLFPAEPFKTTAMGRKACAIDAGRRTEPVPWTPAKTLDGLDRLERSRMLINQRPMVSPLRSWAS